MESEDENDITQTQQFYKMALLYTQTKELHEKYEQEMQISPLKYYLVAKKWLDNYKSKNNYNAVVEKLKDSPKYNDYYSAKLELSRMHKIDKNKLTTIEVENIIENFFATETVHIEQYGIDIPQNIELVYEEFFKDCLNNSNTMGFTNTEVYIGNHDILINDENNKALYCCSLIQSENNNFNFEVKVEYLLIFANIDEKNNQIGTMIDANGLNNYLKKNNIDINKKGEQDLIVGGKKIGWFWKMEEKNNDIFSNNNNQNPNIDLNTNITQPNQISEVKYDFSNNQMKGDQQSQIENPMMNQNNQFSVFNNSLNDTDINKINFNNETLPIDTSVENQMEINQPPLKNIPVSQQQMPPSPSQQQFQNFHNNMNNNMQGNNQNQNVNNNINVNLNINNEQKGPKVNNQNQQNQINNTNNNNNNNNKNLSENDKLEMDSFSNVNKGNLNNNLLLMKKYGNQMNQNNQQNQMNNNNLNKGNSNNNNNNAINNQMNNQQNMNNNNKIGLGFSTLNQGNNIAKDNKIMNNNNFNNMNNNNK